MLLTFGKWRHVPFWKQECSFSGHATDDFGPKWPKTAELFMRMSLQKQYIVYSGFEFYHSVQPKKYKTI